MKIGKYFPDKIEAKWQEKWASDKIFEADLKSSKSHENYYNLVELPYPSGDLHLGHWFAFVPPDAHARYMKMKGRNVIFPNGFDAFGLPAENAAIKHKIHPRDWTLKNIETMKSQFATMGTMIDWSHSSVTCEPDYFKWNQWIFLKMLEKDIAYRGKTLSNWCPTDQTVLANEHIENGKCWRCGSEVEQKEVEQWFLRITEFADNLIWKTPDQKKSNGVEWPRSVMEAQNNWIGRSEGMLLKFDDLEVFTTRPDTTDGATFMVVAPEHPFAKDIDDKKVQDYIKKASHKTELERKEDKTKSGVFTGEYVTNPVTGKKIPVWISDYVLFGYGTGAIMAVPFADERDKQFAEKFNLPIEKTSFKAKPKGEKKISYHLRDWSISRQRYWGTPVPVIHCEKDGIVPVPEKDLPVELPYEVDFTPKGKAPLASAEEWMSVKCPKCGNSAKRDPETLDTFFDSAWYYYRYLSPRYNTKPFDTEIVGNWMPVDVYFGGGEHTLGHTLYARFFTKFFKSLGLVDFDEFALKRIQHGVILGPDGNRMSKSKGNVVNPDDVVKEFGADTVRLYLCFMMPYDATAPWSSGAISGVYRFLKRVWELYEKVSDDASLSKDDEYWMNKSVKKVGEDLENIHFNTAVSTLMEWLNFLSAKEKISMQEYKTFIKILSPFAPHITEEIWHLIDPSAKYLYLEEWPQFDGSKIISEKITIAVQVNGKLRGTVEIEAKDSDNQPQIEEKAKADLNILKYIKNQEIKKVIYIPGKILSFVI